MRYILIMVVLLADLCTNAQDLSGYQIIRSKPVEDLILQVSLHKTHGIVSSTCPIEYGWFTVINKNCMVNLLKDEYFCSAQAFDSAGKSVPLRQGFAYLGKHFFDLKYPSAEQPWSTIENMVSIRPAHGTQEAAGELVFAGQKSTEGRSFYKLEDIFQVTTPGNYKVKLQFQAYERIYKGGQNFVYKLVRFEPIEFIVTKEKKQ